jgi:hypothetical protein
MADSEPVPMERFTQLLETMSYKDQAIWFLNAFWGDLQDAKSLAEEVWDLVQQFKECYSRESKGNSEQSLDMLGAARLLEIRGQTMTANARRDLLKTLDIDNDKRMSLWEYQIHLWSDKKPLAGNDPLWAVKELMTRPQGTNQALEEAKAVLEEVNAALSDYMDKKRKIEAEIEANAGKVVKLNRAKNKLSVLNANNLMTDVRFNKKQVTAEAAVRKAMKAENDTCAGEVWWQERTMAEVNKYKPNKKK